MAHESTTQPTCYPEEKKLYMALELSKAKWLVRCSSGGRKTHQDVVLPNDEKGMAALVRRAKEKLGLAEDAKVVSCYEAGRDGFWPHRFLENLAPKQARLTGDLHQPLCLWALAKMLEAPRGATPLFASTR